MNAEEYAKARLGESINWYNRSSTANRIFYLGAQSTGIVCAAAIPFLSGLADRQKGLNFYIGALGAVIAIATALSSLGRFHEMWIKHRTTAEALKRENYLFETGVEPYNVDDPKTVLVHRIETLLSEENSAWAQIVAKAVPGKSALQGGHGR